MKLQMNYKKPCNINAFAVSVAGSTPAASTNEKTSQFQRLRGFSCICKGFLVCLFAHYLRYLQVIFHQNSGFADELQMKLQMKFGFKKAVNGICHCYGFIIHGVLIYVFKHVVCRVPHALHCVFIGDIKPEHD